MTIDYEIRLAAFKWLNEQEIVYGKPGIEGIPEGLKWGNVFKGKKLFPKIHVWEISLKG